MDSQSSRDEFFLKVACFLTSVIHSTIKDSPHYVLFGQDKRLPHEFLLSTPRPVYNFEDYVKCRMHTFQKSHRLIHDRFTASQQKMFSKEHFVSTRTLEIGDMLFCQHVRHSKLYPLFHGPHRIIEKLHVHKVKIWISKA